MSKVIKHKWRSAKDTVGVVLVKTKRGFKAYIGVAKHPRDEEADVQYIKDRGARLLLKEAQGFFPNKDINEDNYIV